MRLASSSAAFGDTSAPKSLQKNNKIESHIDLELEDINDSQINEGEVYIISQPREDVSQNTLEEVLPHQTF